MLHGENQRKSDRVLPNSFGSEHSGKGQRKVSFFYLPTSNTLPTVHSSRTKTRWGIKTLQACERPTSTTIILLFDTIKRDKKSRTYEADELTCQELEHYLRDILSKRPLSEMNQKLYKCVVCNATFSREVNQNKSMDGERGCF